ncbi:conserved hypothetical protein (DUF1963) [Formosa agariphila KMM 3901]|uniref:DUF1963 domain-containing protein n=1 Tax=Formosa agariphila (strain DSM 15362 / KCTC 12365 / LMG 23005 / KMM 3901 / M-2Alg 35-1) TaxID=1347342 RepID=T2KMF1_FORAG|nr:DUF1963 domain-containing protein [Formosa agariphila]CDF79611.1 conserved hypothetical protein (DUF1963) [Formosa agariphila KMM 3901]
MTVEDIKNKIAKPVTTFRAGGFRPTHTIEESWLGKVYAFHEDEELPTDKHGDLMLPLAQFYLPNLPYVHPNIKKTKLITVFISQALPEQLEPMGDRWMIREYEDLDGITIKNIDHPDSFLKPFPLQVDFQEQDFPLWDGGGLSIDMESEILKLEDEGIIDDYFDISEHVYDHKIGGYPSFCQSGIGDAEGFGEGFQFVFQISSDEKVNLNVVDSGSLMFAKNSETKQWSLYYDFY